MPSIFRPCTQNRSAMKIRESRPALNPLREELQKLAGRPVNFQATSNVILYARDVLFDEPYCMVMEAQKAS